MTKRMKQIYAERREEHECNSAIIERDWWSIRYFGADYCSHMVNEIRKRNRKKAREYGNCMLLDGANGIALIEWQPTNNTQWNKPDLGIVYKLMSYETLVATIYSTGYTPYMVKEWYGYSKTTMKHINLFLEWMNFEPLNKYDWIMMDVGDKYYRDKP